MSSRIVIYLSTLLLATILSNFGRSSSLASRHSRHFSVNRPDIDRFSLRRLEIIANRILSDRRPGVQNVLNPYSRLPTCDIDSPFTSISGTCNNLANPWWGAAKTPLSRMAGARYEDGFNAPKKSHYFTDTDLPSSRVVSTTIHTTVSNISRDHSHLLMNFGQFLDHDLTLSPESGGEGGQEPEKDECCTRGDEWAECFPIHIDGDPTFTRSCVPFLRSAPIPGLPGKPAMRYQMNDLTAYIDASMIYGTTLIKSESLRSHVGGKLRSNFIGNEEVMPDEGDNPSDCFSPGSECRYAAGDVRNSEQAGLTSIHTVFLREHNRMATLLQDINPQWDDERIFQECRKIMSAMLQRITYREFLPVVLGPTTMKRFNLEVLENDKRFSGYSSSIDATIVTEFSAAAFRFGHSLIRESFKETKSGTHIRLQDMFDAYKTTNRFGADSIAKGLLLDGMESCDRFITRGVRDNLFGEELDLPAFNIQRGRDHGLESYQNVRGSAQLPKYTSWDEMIRRTHSMSTINDLKKVYPDPRDIELFPGGMSEIPVAGGVVGETFASIIAEQFKRIKFGDRYWHETDNQLTGFTNAQLREIRKTSLAMIFCNNVNVVTVRPWLMRTEQQGNQQISCSGVPSLNLDAWKDGLPNRRSSPNTQQVVSQRKLANARERRQYTTQPRPISSNLINQQHNLQPLQRSIQYGTFESNSEQNQSDDVGTPWLKNGGRARARGRWQPNQG